MSTRSVQKTIGELNQSKISISKSLKLLVGDVILGSSFVSYAEPFIKKYREAVVKDFLKWLKERKIPMSPNSDPLLLLTNEALGAEWNQQGLLLI